MSFASRQTATPAWAASLPTSLYVFDETVAIATATFSIGGSNDYSSSANISAPAGTWLYQGNFSDYEVRLTLQSGTIGSGTLGSWLSLTTSRSWTNTADRGGTFSARQTGVGLLEIRTASTQVIVSSSQLTLDAWSNAL